MRSARSPCASRRRCAIAGHTRVVRHQVRLHRVLVADLVSGVGDAARPVWAATLPARRPSRPDARRGSESAASSESSASLRRHAAAHEREPVAARSRRARATASRPRRRRPRPTARSARPRSSATGPRRPSRRSRVARDDRIGVGESRGRRVRHRDEQQRNEQVRVHRASKAWNMDQRGTAAQALARAVSDRGHSPAPHDDRRKTFDPQPPGKGGLPPPPRPRDPVVTAQVGLMAMGVVDTMIVGPFSAEALAGVALGTVYFFASGLRHGRAHRARPDRLPGGGRGTRPRSRADSSAGRPRGRAGRGRGRLLLLAERAPLAGQPPSWCTIAMPFIPSSARDARLLHHRGVSADAAGARAECGRSSPR